jgi:hypothetical protein
MTSTQFRPVGQLVRALVAFASAASLGACATAYPENPEPKAVLAQRAETYFGADSEKAYMALDPSNPAYAAARTSMRDDIVNNRIQVYGKELTAYEVALKDSATGVDLGTSLLSLILNGVGATTGSAATKSAVSAAAGGFTAANGVINKEVFKDKTVDAIISQMNADFDRARADIYLNLHQPDAQYPLARAQTDLTSRIRTIGVSSALTEIAQQASQQQQTAQALVQAIRWTSTPQTVRLNNWLKSGEGLDPGHVKALRDWLNAQPEPLLNKSDYPLARFATGDDARLDLEAIRQRALDDPQLSIPK